MTLLLAALLLAQPLPPPPAPETPPSSPPTWRDRLVVDGTLDAYYAYQVGGAGVQTLDEHAFDDTGNSFTLAFARLGLGVRPEPVGARLDVAFGHALDQIEVAELLQGHPEPQGLRHVHQAFLTLAPAPTARVPVVIDVGKFVATMGGETIEAAREGNYSRSLLYAFGLPFAFTGARVTAAVTPRLALRALVTNGWDAVVDNNGAKTFGLAASYDAPTGTTVTASGLGGIETTGTAAPWRWLGRLVVAQALGRAGFMLDAAIVKEGPATWYSVAAYARVAVAAHLDLALRGEVFGDPDGARVTANTSTRIEEVTLTAGIPLFANLALRAEARADFANQPLFTVDTEVKTRQLELLAAALAWF